METARQVVRWSIPGWLFLTAIALFHWTVILIAQGSVQAVLESPSVAMLSPGMVAFAAGAGVPLGFVLYQIYFATYGNFFPFGLVNRDRGGEVFLYLGDASVLPMLRMLKVTPDVEPMYDEVDFPLLANPLRRLKPQFRNAAGKARYRTRVRRNWETVRFWLSLAIVEKSAGALKDDFTGVSDIYHGLGASRISIVIAYVFVTIYNVGINRVLWGLSASRMAAALLVLSIIVFGLLRVFERARTGALDSIQATVKYSLSWHAASATLAVLPVTEPRIAG